MNSGTKCALSLLKKMMKSWMMPLLLFLFCACHERDARGRYRESLQQLDAGARSCQEGAEQYGRAARRAADEGLLGAERLFRALCYSEQVHELRFVEAILQLGGSYRPPTTLYVSIRSTAHNLQEAMIPTRLRSHQSERSEIERVIREGNRYVARLLIRHAAADNRRRRLLKSYLRMENAAAAHYLVCPRCGYLCEELFRDPYCPQCYLKGEYFRCF